MDLRSALFALGHALWRAARCLGPLVVIALLSAACNRAPTRQSEATSPMTGRVVPIAESAPIDGMPTQGDGQGDGRAIYLANCAPCHQPNGEGNLSLFPALNRNPFVTVSDPTVVIDTVLHGRRVMPSFEGALSAEQIAAVISYIRNAWNNQASEVDANQVEQRMKVE